MPISNESYKKELTEREKLIYSYFCGQPFKPEKVNITQYNHLNILFFLYNLLIKDANFPLKFFDDPQTQLQKRIFHLKHVNKQLNYNFYKNAKFFIIKSFNEENIFKAIKYNVWCSTPGLNYKLDNLYKSSNHRYPIIFFFSANKTGYFQGVAQMASTVAKLPLLFYDYLRLTLLKSLQIGIFRRSGRVYSGSNGSSSKMCPTKHFRGS